MYRLIDSERVNELNMQINMLLAQSENTDNPYTESEYRALMHQIDRLTMKRDILLDRVNLQRKKEENREEYIDVYDTDYCIINIIIIISVVMMLLLFIFLNIAT